MSRIPQHVLGAHLSCKSPIIYHKCVLKSALVTRMPSEEQWLHYVHESSVSFMCIMMLKVVINSRANCGLDEMCMVSKNTQTDCGIQAMIGINAWRKHFPTPLYYLYNLYIQPGQLAQGKIGSWKNGVGGKFWPYVPWQRWRPPSWNFCFVLFCFLTAHFWYPCDRNTHISQR